MPIRPGETVSEYKNRLARMARLNRITRNRRKAEGKCLECEFPADVRGRLCYLHYNREQAHKARRRIEQAEVDAMSVQL